MRISDWSSDVCSSDLAPLDRDPAIALVGGDRDVGHSEGPAFQPADQPVEDVAAAELGLVELRVQVVMVEDELLAAEQLEEAADQEDCVRRVAGVDRSEEHTSELQSLMRISYAVFCLKKKKRKTSI